MAKYFYVANGTGHLQIDDTTNLPVRIGRNRVSDFPQYGYTSPGPSYNTVITMPANTIFATFSCDGTDCSDYWFRVVQNRSRVIFQSPSDSPKRSNIYVNFYGLSQHGAETGNAGLKIFDENGTPIFSSLQKQMLVDQVWQGIYSMCYNGAYGVNDEGKAISLNAYPRLTFSKSFPIEIIANSACHIGSLGFAAQLPWFEIAHAVAFTNDKVVKMKAVQVGDMIPAIEAPYAKDLMTTCTKSQFVILKGGNY